MAKTELTGRMKPCKHCGTKFYCSPYRDDPTNGREKLFCLFRCYKDWQKAIPDSERFWTKVQRGDGCWLWTGVLNDDGYGHFRTQAGKEMYGHRFSYMLHKGPIPPRMSVMHICDNTRCVNPAHLEIGTHHENMLDAMRKGRTTRGERNHSAKLTEAQAREILARKGLATGPEVAAEYGVLPGAVRAIWKGRSWKHI